MRRKKIGYIFPLPLAFATEIKKMKFIFMIYFNHFEIPQGKMMIEKFFEKKWKSVKHEIVVILVYCVTFTLIHL